MTTILDEAVERVPIGGHDGRSGASIERVRLADGRRLVVKRMSPAFDITMRLTGDSVGREYVLWREGVLDALPPGIGHAVVDGWQEGDETVLVMRDLGARIRGWNDLVSWSENERLMAALVSMHRALRGSRTSALCPLVDRVALLSPVTMRAVTDATENPLPMLIVRGWELFPKLVPPDVAAAVRAVHEVPAAFAARFGAQPCTVVHADAAHVNIGFEEHQVTLLDWQLATWGAPALELVPYLTASASAVDVSREEILASYRVAAGDSYDDDAVHLALFLGLV
ncbi:MAG: phosphotransferase, partial [Acidimicrobiia bacterium]